MLIEATLLLKDKNDLKTWNTCNALGDVREIL